MASKKMVRGWLRSWRLRVMATTTNKLRGIPTQQEINLETIRKVSKSNGNSPSVVMETPFWLLLLLLLFILNFLEFSTANMVEPLNVEFAELLKGFCIMICFKDFVKVPFFCRQVGENRCQFFRLIRNDVSMSVMLVQFIYIWFFIHLIMRIARMHSGEEHVITHGKDHYYSVSFFFLNFACVDQL
jgi:hypothetical protein